MPMIKAGRLGVAILAALVATVGAVRAQTIEAWQERLYQQLVRQQVISPETKLISATFVCTLTVGGRDWRVVNVVEHVPGAQVPRGHNQIVLMDRALKVLRKFDYADEYPMACHGATLYVHGDYGIDNTAPYGNTLTFSPAGDVTVTSTEANDLPFPLTRARKAFRQR